MGEAIRVYESRRWSNAPELLQRPLVVNGDQAVLGRPVERVLEIL